MVDERLTCCFNSMETDSRCKITIGCWSVTVCLPHIPCACELCCAMLVRKRFDRNIYCGSFAYCVTERRVFEQAISYSTHNFGCVIERGDHDRLDRQNVFNMSMFSKLHITACFRNDRRKHQIEELETRSIVWNCTWLVGAGRRSTESIYQRNNKNNKINW